jgi:hypothetical protein
MLSYQRPLILPLQMIRHPLPTTSNLRYLLLATKKKKYTNHEILQALEGSCQMGGKSNWGTILIIVVVNFFPELGGASRMLKFLMVPSNMHNMEYVKLVGEIIFSCAYGGKNGEDDDIA